MNRQIPPVDQQFTKWIQAVNDRLDRLERGAQNAGRVSFSNEVQVGNILITTTGDTVRFTNVQDGKTATITLT